MPFNVMTRTNARQFHTFARSKMPQRNIVNVYSYYPMPGFMATLCIDRRHQPLSHGVNTTHQLAWHIILYTTPASLTSRNIYIIQPTCQCAASGTCWPVYDPPASVISLASSPSSSWSSNQRSHMKRWTFPAWSPSRSIMTILSRNQPAPCPLPSWLIWTFVKFSSDTASNVKTLTYVQFKAVAKWTFKLVSWIWYKVEYIWNSEDSGSSGWPWLDAHMWQQEAK